MMAAGKWAAGTRPLEGSANLGISPETGGCAGPNGINSRNVWGMDFSPSFRHARRSNYVLALFLSLGILDSF